PARRCRSCRRRRSGLGSGGDALRCSRGVLLFGSAVGGHPGGRCPRSSLPGGPPPSPVVWGHCIGGSATGRVSAGGGETPHHVHQERLLDGLDPFVEGRLGVVLAHLDRG